MMNVAVTTTTMTIAMVRIKGDGTNDDGGGPDVNRDDRCLVTAQLWAL